MELALLAARIVLAAVFATAAVAKLADLPGSRQAAAEFGVPRRLVGPLGTLLPVVELGTAVVLVPDPSARWGALASLALLLGFSAGIALSLIRGRTPDCHCFGRLHSVRVSWWTVARNGLLALVAAGLAWGSTPAAILLAALAAALGVTVLERRRGGEPAAPGLPVGAEAPDFRLPALDGAAVSLATLRERGQPVLLVFSDPGCGPCSALAPRLARWQRDPAGELSVWVVARGDLAENRTKAEEHGLANVLLDSDQAVADAYGALGTPSAVLVGADGRVASRLVAAEEAIERLVSDGGGATSQAPVVEPRARLTRLELLARAGSAAAALVLLGARDALAGAIPIVVKCKYVRCGDRCCPKKAVCGTRRGKKVCICPDGRETCGAKCCPETFDCRKTARGRRVCVCPPRTRPCRGRCVSLTDAANCGRCGTECPPATVCVSGQCVGGDGSGTGPGGVPPCECPPGRTCCDGACADLNTDEAHCGRCDQPCPAGQQCCDGTCKDLRLDPQNCGECGKRCPSGQVCAGGRCGGGCPTGLTNCDGRCVDLAADNANCLRCGRICAEGQTCCGEADCVDTRIRPDHCAACFRVCPEPPCTCWNSRCSGPPDAGCWDGLDLPVIGRWRARAARRARARAAH